MIHRYIEIEEIYRVPLRGGRAIYEEKEVLDKQVIVIAQDTTVEDILLGLEPDDGEPGAE